MDTPIFQIVTLERTLAKVRELHHNDPDMRCGAVCPSQTITHKFSNHVETKDLRCNQNVGHDGGHRDSSCCWSVHNFPEDFVPAAPQPYDVWTGRACSCGGVNCKTRALLDMLDLD